MFSSSSLPYPDKRVMISNPGNINHRVCPIRKKKNICSIHFNMPQVPNLTSWTHPTKLSPSIKEHGTTKITKIAHIYKPDFLVTIDSLLLLNHCIKETISRVGYLAY